MTQISLPEGFALRNSRDSPTLFRTAEVRSIVHAFLSTPEVYWGHGRSQAVIDRQIDRATICFGMFKQENGPMLVGFTRVVGDGERFAYLADVFILPEYRGLGLGKSIIIATIAGSGDPAVDDIESRDSRQWRWILFATKAKDLYLRLGFEQADTAYCMKPGALKI